MTYADLGGERGDIPAAYVPAIYRDCPNCGALMMERCVNPATGRERAAPCVNRDKEPTGE